MKTLYLEKRGCDFFANDNTTVNSDIGNYRVGVYDYSIHGKNGKDYILEFCHWTRYEYRKTHKITGRPLKHPVKELKNLNALLLNTQYENECGCFCDLSLESITHEKNPSYTLADILAVVNEISAENYDNIEFIN